MSNPADTRMSRRWPYHAAFALAVLGVTLILLELAIAFLLDHSTLLGANPTAFQQYYMLRDRKIIQLQPEFAVYDSSLGYTLKPGRFRFRNREFDVEFSVNSAGMRDDEASLHSPKIIVLGDSHAMGWGVAQDETFADKLERKTGQRVLNTAVASYGTVREMKMLQRVNLDSLKALIIQYCQNDMLENKTFAADGNRLNVMPEEKYARVVQIHQRLTRYYFGKHTYCMLKTLYEGLAGERDFDLPEEKDSPAWARDEASNFLNALAHSGIDLSNVRVIVFEVNRYATNDSVFVGALRRRLAEEDGAGLAKKITVLDLSSILTREKYFRLDDHMTELGHRAIADTLATCLIRMKGAF